MKTESDSIKFLNRTINNNLVLIFDLDGTLVDTDEANFLSYKDAIKIIMKIDINLSPYPQQRFTRKLLKQIIPRLSDNKYHQIIELKNKLFDKYLDKTKLNSIIVEILKKYRDINTLILSTNSHKERAIKVLMFHNLFDKFNYKFYKDDIIYKKDMNKYKYVIIENQILPNQMVIFENEELEINNALSLGILPKNIIRI